MNKERSLAHIEIITDIQPIPEKDRIVLARVLGWNVVVGKGEFEIGDKVVYVEIDSRLNTDFELFNILAKDADRYGFAQIKTRRFGGAYSQGICFRVPEKHRNSKPGTDLTKYFNKGKEERDLRIIHSEEYAERKADWDKPWKKEAKPSFWERILYRLFPKRRMARKKESIPSPYDIGVAKTDEERIQNHVELFEELKANRAELTLTEKLDGQSFTAHIDAKGEIYVASRNVPLFFSHSEKTKQSGTY